jgi:hypothetical protein
MTELTARARFSLLFALSVATGIRLATAAQCDPLRFDSPQTLGIVQDEDITEASGLAASWKNPGVFWTHNDGSTDVLFAFAADGRLLGKYHLNKSPDDFEDMAIGPGPDGQSYLYAGDIGSNNASKERVKIYRAPEPEVSTGQESKRFDLTGVQSFTIKYPEGSFDAEALLLDPIGRQLYVITKEDDGARIFKYPLDQLNPDKAQTFELAGQISFAKVNGGSISRDGRFIALRRENHAEGWYRDDGEDIAQTLQRTPTDIPVVGPPEEENGESIDFLPDSSGYVTLSEGMGQSLFFFRNLPSDAIPIFADAPRLTSEGWEFHVTACPGTNVALDRSTNLRSWSQAAEISANGEVQVLRDGRFDQAFYRLRVR